MNCIICKKEIKKESKEFIERDKVTQFDGHGVAFEKIYFCNLDCLDEW